MIARLVLALAVWGICLAPAGAEVRVEPAEAAAASAEQVSREEPRGELAGRDVVLERLSRAWAIPARELSERVERLQSEALDLRLANLEAPAQAMLLDENAGPALDRAQAARDLAPELPAARAALARARWAAGEPRRALAELAAATRSVPLYVEAETWLEASLWTLVQRTAWVSGAAILLLALLVGLPESIRRLGGWMGDVGAPSRAALLGTLLLAPAAAGEGMLGVMLATLALATGVGGWARWSVCAVAGALLLVGTHPALERAARARVELANLGVVPSVQQVERAVGSPVERERIWQHAHTDPLAARASAMEMHRRGDVEGAAARYAQLVAGSDSATLANNAAAAQLALGQREAAMTLLEGAVGAGDDTVLLFNLSQVYGALVRIDDQNRALADAQGIDADRLHQLTDVFGPGRMTDLPLRNVEAGAPDASPARMLDAATLAAALRHPWAPGWLGARASQGWIGLAAALAAGFLVAMVLGRTRSGDEDLRTRITRLVENRGGDSEERIRRLGELRAREAALARIERMTQFLVPGFAGMRGGRPWLGAGALVVAMASLCLVGLREGPVAVPLALGTWPGLVLPWLLVVTGTAYVGLTGLAIWLEDRA